MYIYAETLIFVFDFIFIHSCFCLRRWHIYSFRPNNPHRDLLVSASMFLLPHSIPKPIFYVEAGLKYRQQRIERVIGEPVLLAIRRHGEAHTMQSWISFYKGFQTL